MPQTPLNINDDSIRNNFLTNTLPDAIESLKEDVPPKWGRMSAQHMLEHLLQAFQISTGKLKVQCQMPKEKREQFKAFLYTSRPMPKGFQNLLTGDKLPPPKLKNLQLAKDSLNDEIQQFLNQKAHFTYINPVFGKLGPQEWQRFHFKHSFHHLSQFGLIERKEG